MREKATAAVSCEWNGKASTERQMLLWVRAYEKRYFGGRRLVVAVKIQPKLDNPPRSVFSA
jgi:hypothetical protein